MHLYAQDIIFQEKLGTTVTIYDLILFTGAALALLMSLAYIFRFRKSNLPANYYLISFLIVLFLGFALKLVSTPALYQSYPHLSKWNYPMGLLRPPLFFLYFFYITRPGARFRKTDLLHFIPFVGLLLFFLPYYILTGEEKLQIMENSGKWRLPGIYSWFGMAYSIVYFLLSLRQFIRLRQLSDKLEALSLKKMRVWLLYLLIGYASFLVVAVLPLVIKNPSLEYYPFLILSLVFMVAFARMLTLPDLLTEERTKEKQTKTTLSESQREEIMSTIKRVMEEEKLFTRDNLRIIDLAEKLQLPEYVVSQVINTTSGETFSALINRYRIQLAKRLLQDPKYERHTVEAIGYESGFYSKASFYNAFKKETGLSPAEFRKNKLSS